MKVAISGGHITPAQSLIQYLHQQGDQSVVLGRTSLEASHKSLEQAIAAQYSASFYPIKQVKFDRYHKTRSIIRTPQLFIAIKQVVTVLRAEKPDVCVSFGGYPGLILAFSASLLRLPVVVHEQTTQAGFANRLSSVFACQIAISHQSSQKYFPSRKTVLTGNLIRQEFFTKQTKPEWIPDHHLPIILVTGGSQGSQIIDTCLSPLIPQLTRQNLVIHQSRNPISTSYKNYISRQWFSATQKAWLHHHCWVVISRSGANTISEIQISGKPSILIPLKGSQKNEQLHNAKLITDHHAGILIKQDAISSEMLNQAIHEIKQNDLYAQNAQKYKLLAQNNAQRLYQLVVSACA